MLMLCCNASACFVGNWTK